MKETGKLVRKEILVPDFMQSEIKRKAKEEGETENVIIRKALRQYLNSTSVQK